MPIIVATVTPFTPESSALLAAVAEPANRPPRIRLTVNASQVAGAADAVITRTSTSTGTAPVRQANPLPLTGGIALVYDYEAPYGMLVTYSVTVRNAAGGTVASGVAAATLAVPRPWLVHPGVPSLSVELPKVKALAERTRKVNQGVHEPLGRAMPIVVTDGRRKAVTSTLTVRTRTLLELDRLTALLDDTSPLLLNVPATLGWGVTAEYVAVGDTTESRDLDVGADPYRLWTFPYMVVAAPVGNVQAQRTYANVVAEATTYTQVLEQSPTYLAVIAPGA